VRHYLHCPTQIVSSTFPLNNMLIDLASRDVILAGESDIEIALVIAEVEVDFSTVVEYEDLTMSASTLA